ncbi:MAG: hypothetical protein NVSMB38_45340 [Ktedonobacteraceae bacterium]
MWELEFRAVLHALPDDTGMAYVFVQHLAPTHETHLPELLARETQMPVHEAREGMDIRANHVYVIAPNTDMTLSKGVLRLQPRTESRGQHLSVDTFLQSLAESRASGAIGVILSGAAADGTRGLQAIKAAGGMTFAQDPTTAQFSSMPHDCQRTHQEQRASLFSPVPSSRGRAGNHSRYAGGGRVGARVSAHPTCAAPQHKHRFHHL